MYLYFVRPQLVPKPWGKESPPRQKIKAGTDPDVPRMRYTDDTFDGNLVQPVWLRNHLLMLTVRKKVFWTNRILYRADFFAYHKRPPLPADLFPGIYIFKRFQVQTGSECVLSDPDPAFTLVPFCLHTWRVPLQNKTTQLAFHTAGWDLAQIESKMRMEKNICPCITHLMNAWCDQNQ